MGSGSRLAAAALALLILPVGAHAATPPAVFGPELQGFAYPFPVSHFALRAQNQTLSMAYMDVAPTGAPNGRTAVLLHGKNFCGATWESTIRALAGAGFRVIVPDQIGFCKSSKPRSFQYSFQQLAEATRGLLRARGVERAVVVGHSMGGMLAARYALMYPQAVEQLVLVDPLGLEDWQAKGVPYADVDQLYAGEMKTTRERLKAYQLKFYYNGQWRAEYDRWIDMQWGMYAGAGRGEVAWSQALTSEMIYTQPVIHELASIRPPTVLMIGGRDRTAPGADRAPAALRDRLGRYDELGPAAARAIPGARLVVFPDLGHAPQVEAPARFHAALLAALAARPVPAAQ